MTLKHRIEEDLKHALRAGDETRKSTLRMLLAAISNARIATQKEVDDDGVVGLIQREIKQRRESIDLFDKGNRPDLVAKETAEIGVLEPYLPEQLGAAELRELVSAVIGEVGATGPGDRGRVMAAVMPRVKGKADGRSVSTVVGELLGA